MNKPSMQYLWLGVFILTLAICPFCPSDVSSSNSVDAGDCKGCHEQQLLPAEHPETKGKSLADCKDCHKKCGSSFRSKMPLNHAHKLAEIGCADCHGQKEPPEAIFTDQCLACHGTGSAVAERTAEQDPNPHNSPHYGVELDCDLCHHVHEESEIYCNRCHAYNFVVP